MRHPFATPTLHSYLRVVRPEIHVVCGSVRGGAKRVPHVTSNQLPTPDSLSLTTTLTGGTAPDPANPNQRRPLARPARASATNSSDVIWCHGQATGALVQQLMSQAHLPSAEGNVYIRNMNRPTLRRVS